MNGFCDQRWIHGRPWVWFAMWVTVSILMSMVTPAELVRAETRMAFIDIEARGGMDYLCGTCGPYHSRPMMQLFADVLVPIMPLWRGAVEIGPYGKGALLDGHIPQIAGGVLAGYRIGDYELLGHIGRAYATERIGETAAPYSGQTKGTYDLGVLGRYAISQRFFLSAGYQHNSNGEGLGVKFIREKGTNRGIDSVEIGIGVRF